MITEDFCDPAVFNQDTAECTCCFSHFYQFAFRPHCFSVAGTCDGPMDDKYRSAESVSGQLGAVRYADFLSGSLPSHALFVFFAPASTRKGGASQNVRDRIRGA